MLRPLFLVLLWVAPLLPCAVSATVWGETSEPPVQIGALQRSDLEEISSQEAIFLDRLRRELLPRQVTLQYYGENDLIHMVQNGALNFVITDAAVYASLQSAVELRPLAGLVYPEAADADHMTASVAFTAQHEAGSLSLAEIKGRRLFVTDKHSFGGFLAFAVELKDEGFDPEDFFSDVSEFQKSDAELVKTVLKTPGAVGVLPACTLERLQSAGFIDAAGLTVINAKNGGGLTCRHSTKVYPGWVLASLPSSDLGLVRMVAATALAATSPGMLQWSFPPTDFRRVHNMLIDLGIGPYAGNEGKLWKGLFLRYRWWFAGIALFMLLILAHGVFVAWLVRTRTKDLRLSLLKQQKMTDEILQTRARLQSMEKVQTVSHMSTLFAHELKQPLAAIRNFSLGLLRRSQRGELDAETMHSILEKMVFLTEQASNIVNHVRKYAKAGKTERLREDFRTVIREAVESFGKTADFRVQVSLSLPLVPVWVEINRWEIELVILNLIKNAAEATHEVKKPKIEIVLTEDEHHAIMRITDNGKGSQDVPIDEMFRPLFSTKTGGMGLGLSIAESVAESHGGRLNARQNTGPGLTMEMILPLYQVFPEAVD